MTEVDENCENGQGYPVAPAPFVVGVPRPGTTLLRLMLDAHPLVAILPETHFVPKLLRRCGDDPDLAGCAIQLITSHQRWRDFGLDAGEPLPEGDDLYGTPVIVASRLCDTAGAGEILASEVVSRVAGPRISESMHPVGGLTFPSPLPRRALDFIFLPAGCMHARSEIVRSFLSDHRPVAVEFDF